jgi:hypothetical protein
LTTFSASIGLVKLGHPQPLSNLSIEVKRGSPDTNMRSANILASPFRCGNLQICPLIYIEQSAVCKRYADFQKLIHSSEHPGTDDARRTLKELANSDSRDFPPLMRDKLRHFDNHVDANGLADTAAWKLWVSAAVISSTESTAALRARLCNLGINVVGSAQLIARNPSRAGAIADEYTYLAKRYASIVTTLPSSVPVTAPAVAGNTLPEAPPAFESPFSTRHNSEVDGNRQSYVPSYRRNARHGQDKSRA